MVTSVNGNALATLTARENALANRPPTAQTADSAAASPARDPAVLYAGSGDAPNISALLAVQDSLNRAAAISDVAINAGTAIGDLLGVLREKAVAAQGATSPDETSALNRDYQKLLQTIDQIANSASFQGVKVVDGSSSADLQFKADVNGDSQLSLTPQDFTTGGPVLGLAETDLLGSKDDLAALLDHVDSASAGLTGQLSQLSAQSDQIQAHMGVLGLLQSALAGQQPADLNADGARLQALQVQQMLTGQSAGLANQTPQTLLSLFRS